MSSKVVDTIFDLLPHNFIFLLALKKKKKKTFCFFFSDVPYDNSIIVITFIF